MSKVESKRGRLDLLLKTNVKGINNPTTFGQVEKTSSKTIVIMDPKTKAKKSPCLHISRVSKAQKL
jgi:hypothetical protein